MNEFNKEKPIHSLSNEEVLNRLKRLTNAVEQPLLNFNQTETRTLNIRPDKSMPPAIFKPDPLIVGGYVAHPDTIVAMRKDIFVSDPELLDLEMKYQCDGCKQNLDLQFWLHCPFCGKDFPR